MESAAIDQSIDSKDSKDNKDNKKKPDRQPKFSKEQGQQGQEPAAKASQLPKPTGFQVLIMLPEVEETTAGGIYKGDDEIERERVSSIVGFVLKMGPDCYKDQRKFPNGPYCKEGDWVMFRAYTGTRFKIHGKELRLLNDDSVQAVIDDPRGVTKV